MIAKLEKESREMVANGDSTLAKPAQKAPPEPPKRGKIDDDDEEENYKRKTGFRDTTNMTGSNLAGDNDEDSEGIENVREEMLSFSQDLVKDLEKRMTKHVSQEIDRVLNILSKYREVVEKR